MPPDLCPLQVGAAGGAGQTGVGAEGQGIQQDLVHALTHSSPQQQKQLIGEHLYQQIYAMHSDLAGKITGVCVCVCVCV